MIRINKTANIPNVLITKGTIETNNLNSAFIANPVNYTSRTGVAVNHITKMSFDNTIYGHPTVKSQLISEQHGKCCFCEAKFIDNSFGDVEHFRPKKAYRKRGSRNLTYPGYYWLAYDWNNLMFSCEQCNRKYKKNEFPLYNEATRKENHVHTNLLDNEERLLINPIEEDPAAFITFNEEVPVPVGGSLKGTTSIQVYGLERLNNSRLENLQALKRALVFVNIDATNASEINRAATDLKINPSDLIELIISANKLFNSAAKDDAKFAQCVRCSFTNLPTV